MFLRCYTAVTVSCQNPGRSADAIIGILGVYTVAIFAISRVLTFIHTYSKKMSETVKLKHYNVNIRHQSKIIK